MCPRTKTNYTIPNSVTTIGECAFSDCALTSVSIPESVTNIEYQAFINCSNLTTVKIPSKVSAIGSLAFNTCTNLSTIYCNAEIPPTLADDGVFMNISNGAILYVKKGYGDTYKNADYWTVNLNIVELDE